MLVCVDGRCAAKGSEGLYARLWSLLEENSLAYYKSGGSIRLTASSCLGACDYGPTVATYPGSIPRRTPPTGIAERAPNPGNFDTGGENVDARHQNVDTWHYEMTEESALALARKLHIASR